MGKRTRISYSIICSLAAAICIPALAFAPYHTYALETGSKDIRESDNCTAVYIGSAVSKDGTAIIARCVDTHPTTTACYLNICEASDEPGRIVAGNNGFKYTLPDHTYKYFSVPRPKAMDKGYSWDSAASNENGLAVTATVTSYVREEALKADPYVEDGISEDNIAGIIAACSDSSRSAIELIADIVDTKGSAESNILMAADQDECWYMEIYTGHQYAAVKLPDDMVAGFGNEFMLETLGGFEDTITSEDLEALPRKAGFAAYNESELNLFDTYTGKGRLADYGNLRTWRIHQLLAPSTAGKYNAKTKYDFLYKPDKKVSVPDVIDIYRDRYEGTRFEKDIDKGKTRVIATETASEVHVMQIHPDLPKEIAVVAWLCISNAGYAPFVPVSNGVTQAADKYTYVMPAYEPDDKAAFCVYKKLNALAAQDRTYYGPKIEEMWQEYESIWLAQTKEVLLRADKAYRSDGKDSAFALLTDYSTGVQEQALSEAERAFDDLMWYVMENTDTLRYEFSYDTLELSDEPVERSVFMPLVEAESYAKNYGWTVSKKGKKFIFTLDDRKVTVIPSDGSRTSSGTISDGKDTEEIRTSNLKKLYIPFDTALAWFKT